MLNHEAHKLFRRIMLMGEEGIPAKITPTFLFEIILRLALRELVTQSYTAEGQRFYKLAREHRDAKLISQTGYSTWGWAWSIWSISLTRSSS